MPGVPTEPVTLTILEVTIFGTSFAVLRFAPMPTPQLSLDAVVGLPVVWPLKEIGPEPESMIPDSYAMP